MRVVASVPIQPRRSSPSAPARAREIGKLGIANVSNLRDVSDYVACLRDDHGQESSVFLPGHRRSDGFWPLLARAAQSAKDAPARGPIAAEWRALAARISNRMQLKANAGSTAA